MGGVKQCVFCTTDVRTDYLPKHYVDKHRDECLTKYSKYCAKSARLKQPVLQSDDFVACLVCKKGNCKGSQRDGPPVKWLANHTNSGCFTEANWELHKPVSYTHLTLPTKRIV